MTEKMKKEAVFERLLQHQKEVDEVRSKLTNLEHLIIKNLDKLTKENKK